MGGRLPSTSAAAGSSAGYSGSGRLAVATADAAAPAAAAACGSVGRGSHCGSACAAQSRRRRRRCRRRRRGDAETWAWRRAARPGEPVAATTIVSGLRAATASPPGHLRPQHADTPSAEATAAPQTQPGWPRTTASKRGRISPHRSPATACSRCPATSSSTAVGASPSDVCLCAPAVVAVLRESAPLRPPAADSTASCGGGLAPLLVKGWGRPRACR